MLLLRLGCLTVFFWGTVWWEVLTVLAASCYLARSWVSNFFWTETSRKERKLQLIECWFPKLRVTGRQRCVTTSSKRSHSMATFLRWKKCKKIRRKCKKCGKCGKKPTNAKKMQKKMQIRKKKRKKMRPNQSSKNKKQKKKGKKRDSPLNRLEAPQKNAALLSPRQHLSLSKTCPLATFVP